MQDINLIVRGIKQLEKDLLLTKDETTKALDIISRRENLFQVLLAELEHSHPKKASGE